MANLIEEINKQYTPEQCITVYKSSGSDYYLETQEIKNGKLCEALPLTEESIARMVDFFSDKQMKSNTISGFIPENMLYLNWSADSKVMCWYNRPMERMMHFRQDLHIPSGLAWQPTVIYLVDNNNLYVYTAKAIKVTSKTPVFMAPYHNVSDNGSVCLGSAKIKKPEKLTYENLMNYWEAMFWGSVFTHHGNEDCANTNINLYWKKSVRKTSVSGNKFDLSILKPYPKTTLEKQIKKII